MNYKEIVAEAWEFTQDNKKMALWYGAIPSVFTTVAGIGYLIYQYYSFLSSKLFQNWQHSFLSLFFTSAITFLQAHRGVIVPLLVVGIIELVGYYLIPVICKGALIQLIARRRNGQQVRTRQGLSYGLLSFLPLFEYGLFVGTFSVWSIATTFALMIRQFGTSILAIVLPVFILISVIGLVMAIFFTYSEFYIIIDGDGVFTSISKSVNLVLMHWEETILLTVLMLIIGVRIILQILMVFLVPGIAIGAFYLLTLAKLPQLAYLVGGSLGVFSLLVASYLNGMVHVFAITVWTFTFLELTANSSVDARGEKKKKDKDKNKD